MMYVLQTSPSLLASLRRYLRYVRPVQLEGTKDPGRTHDFRCSKQLTGMQDLGSITPIRAIDGELGPLYVTAVECIEV